MILKAGPLLWYGNNTVHHRLHFPSRRAARLGQMTVIVIVCHAKVLPCVTSDLTLIWIKRCDHKQARNWHNIAHECLWNSFLSVSGLCCKVWMGNEKQRCSGYSWEHISLRQLSFYVPPWARITALTLRASQCQTYASNLWRINNRMILCQSVQLLWLLCCWLRRSQEAPVPGF